MPARVRPTSPHIQVYRWQIGNTLSILHRLTGAALAVGLLALSYWLMALAAGPGPYLAAMRFFHGPFGLAVVSGWSFAFFYHLLNGVRHLFWDAGRGFEPKQRQASGWAAVIGALALTLCAAAWVWPRL